MQVIKNFQRGRFIGFHKVFILNFEGLCSTGFKKALPTCFPFYYQIVQRVYELKIKKGSRFDIGFSPLGQA